MNEDGSFGMLGGPKIIVILLVCAAMVVLLVVPSWFICKKAGFSPWMSLIALIPSGIGIVILLFILAFAKWPNIPASDSLTAG